MKSIHSLLVLGLTVVGVGAGVACEGEPPKTAESAIVPQAQVLPTASAEEAPAEATQAAAPPAPTCCQCQCAGADAGAPTAVAGDAGAVVASASDAGAPAPAAPSVGDIVGDVTTTPAYLRGVSVVYLADAPTVPGRGMSARMNNHNMAFAPLLQVVAQGGSLAFSNDDPFPHNVFSPDHGRFDLGLVQPGHTVTHTFKTAGAYTLLCNQHPNMLGWVVVTPSSYFAKTDARGHFVIKDVPAGKYSIVAWAPRLQTVTEPVEVKEKETKIDFELHR